MTAQWLAERAAEVVTRSQGADDDRTRLREWVTCSKCCARRGADRRSRGACVVSADGGGDARRRRCVGRTWRWRAAEQLIAAGSGTQRVDSARRTQALDGCERERARGPKEGALAPRRKI
jgi:hypothetical protein